MKTIISSLLIAAGVSAFAPAVSAQEYMFTYSKLYSQLKNNVKEGHEDVKVGVFFINADTRSRCDITKAWMEKEKHYEELKVSAAKELMLPVDTNLKSANPLVFVRTPMDQRCDFSLVVMTKQPMKGNVSYADVEKLLPQMQSMLEDLGGMFASWFTPEVEGVTLEFAKDVNGNVETSDGKKIPVENGIARVLLSDIPADGFLNVPYETNRVLPWLPSAKK